MESFGWESDCLGKGARDKGSVCSAVDEGEGRLEVGTECDGNENLRRRGGGGF